MNMLKNSLENISKVHDAKILNEVIAVCRDGCNFYRHAAQQVDDQTLRNLFLGMAGVKADIVNQLTPEVEACDVEANTSGTLVGRLRQWYADAKDNFSNYHDYIFIEQLEEAEDRTLSVLRKAVKSVESNRLASQLSSQVASAQMTHDRMKALKEVNHSHHH